jgi:hypothetical protein
LKPAAFASYLRAHRAWLVKLLEAQFNRKIQ